MAEDHPIADETTTSAIMPSFPVRPYLPEGMEILLADGLYVSYQHGSFILSFVQVEHPLVTTPEEASEIKVVRSRCVGRFAISPERIGAMVQVLREQITRTAKEQLQKQAQPGQEGE